MDLGQIHCSLKIEKRLIHKLQATGQQRNKWFSNLLLFEKQKCISRDSTLFGLLICNKLLVLIFLRIGDLMKALTLEGVLVFKIKLTQGKQ